MEKFRNIASFAEKANAEVEMGEGEEWEINNLLSYELIRKDEIWLHITDARYLRLSIKLKLLKDGFRELAHILRTNPMFKDVRIVTGLSWIIAKNSKLIRSLGFDITEDLTGLEDQLKIYWERKDEDDIHLDITPAYAYMEKERFLSLFDVPQAEEAGSI